MMQNMGPLSGTVPNAHVLRGQQDIDTQPVTYARYATRWGDAQLSNGWQGTNYGKRFLYQAAAYLAEIVPTWPGQTRLAGQSTPSAFPLKGMAPSQWDAHVANGPGAQPDTPGGPGQTLGPVSYYGGGGA